jgi:hypothetical protein
MALSGLITAIFGKPRKRPIDRLKQKKNGFLYGRVKIFGVKHNLVLIPIAELDDGTQASYDPEDRLLNIAKQLDESPFDVISLPRYENGETVYYQYVALVFPRCRMYRKYFQEPKNEREIYG